MRRTLFITATTVVLALLQALPALAAGAGDAGEVAKGSAQGILLAFVFGIIGGTAITIHAYRGVDFGREPGHQEHADDIREGMAEYEPSVDA